MWKRLRKVSLSFLSFVPVQNLPWDHSIILLNWSINKTPHHENVHDESNFEKWILKQFKKIDLFVCMSSTRWQPRLLAARAAPEPVKVQWVT